MTQEEKDRADTIAFDRNYCTHYDMAGMPERCKAGVKYDEVGDYKTRPCIGGHKMPDATTRCSKWERRSLEHAEARADRREECERKMRLVFPVVGEWRKKLPIGKHETIECPACQGKLHLSQARINGHVWGRCETKGCVSWME